MFSYFDKNIQCNINKQWTQTKNKSIRLPLETKNLEKNENRTSRCDWHSSYEGQRWKKALMRYVNSDGPDKRARAV